MYTTHLITHNCYLSSNQSSILKVRGECNVTYEYNFTFILPYRIMPSTIHDLYATNLKVKVQNHIN